ncbi:MAG: Ig-like domain-containing protein [Actinomycetes bacterium]
MTQRRRRRPARLTTSGRPESRRVRRLHALPKRITTIGTLSLASFLALPLTPAFAANAPVVTGPTSPGNSRTPAWSFTADATATTDCRTLSGGTVIVDWAPCDQNVGYSVDLTGQSDATYTAEIRATDGAGSATTDSDYVLDTTPPVAPTITSTPVTPSTSRTPGWAWTLPEGAGECQLVRGATVVSPWTACTSPLAFDLAAAPDGVYTFEVHAVDDAGNLGADATSDYTLDTTAPAAPAVVTTSATPGSSTTATFTFTGEAGASANCRLLQDGTPISAYASCSSPDVEDLTGNPDGTYSLEVYLVDAAGNVGPTGSSDYVLDRQAPSAPSIDTDPGTTGNDTSPTWTFSGEAGATFTCRLDGPSGAGTYSTCTSPFTPTLSQGDGSYTFLVRATDAAANTGSAASSTYLLDTTAPAAPVVTAPASPAQSSTPTFTFTAEPGASTECRLDGPAGIGSWAPCASPQTPTLSNGDGTYTLRVRATDAVGNTGTAGSANYQLDRQSPAAPVVTGPAGPASTTTISWTFTAEAGASTECQLTGPAGASSWSACTSPVVRTLSQGDGSYTMSVRATDAAGNVSPVGASTYVLDTTGPTGPSVTGPASPGSDTTPTFTFTTEAGATTECRLIGPASTTAWASCTSPLTAAANQGDGSYTFEVRATDAAGNLGTISSTAYVLDTTAPAAPTVTAPASPGNSTAVSFSFTAEAGASTECRLTGPGTVGSFAACTSPFAATLTGGDGAYTFSVRAIDAAGNVGAIRNATYTLDTQAPGTPTVSPPSSPDNNTSAKFTFNTPGGTATLECRLDGPAGTGTWATCTSPDTLSLVDGDGAYTLLVRAIDAAGNVSTPGSGTYVLDTAAPAAPVVSGPTGPAKISPVTWTFTAEVGATTQCRLLYAGAPVTAYANCASPKSFNLNSGDGTYAMQVKATDAAGNTGPAGTSASYLLDTTAPSTPSVSGPVSPGNTSTVTFSFTAEAGASTECRLDGPSGIGAWAACTSPAIRALGQGDGSYAFRVRATDVAGNVSATGSATYVLDTAAPAAPVVTPPHSPGNVTSVSFAFTAEAGAATQCRLTGPGGVGAWGSCTSPTVVAANQGDGTYTFEVRATDAAGNTSPVGSAAYVLDTAAPAPPVVTGPTGPSNVTSVSWMFTAEAGATTECRLFLGATAVTAWHSCSSPDTEWLSAGDGSYTLSVRATDPAGNLGPSGTSAVYVLDTAAPAAPSVTGPATPGKNSAVSYTFTAEAGATTECRLDGPSGVGPWVSCTSPRAVSLSQGDGFYVFRVRATDAAGNVSAVSSVGYTLDTVAPLAPTIAASPLSPGNNRSPSWSFTVPEGSALCQVSRGATVVVAFTPCASPYIADLTTQPDGTYTLSVETLDAAGNVSVPATSNYVLDTTPPVPTGLSPATGTNSNDTTPTWTFTVEAGATSQCEVMRGSTVVLAFAACTSPFTADLSSAGDGTYTFLVKATDVAGNAGSPVSVTYVLDTAAPAAPVITSAPPTVSSNRSPSWGFTAETGATLQCRLYPDGTTPGGWSTCTSPYVANLATAADGTYDFEVRAIDPAGNIGASTTRVYTLDTTPPVAPSLVSAPGSPSPTHMPAWSFSTEAGATTECQLLDSTGPIAAWASCSSPYVGDLTTYPDGNYTFQVRATDAAGNTGPALSVSYTLDSTAPNTPTIVSAPVGPASDRTPTWTFVGEPGATFTCKVMRGTSIVLAPTTCTSPFTANLAGQPDGTYTLTVTATDPSGNTSAGSTASYVLDTTPPGAPRFTRLPVTPDALRTPSWSWARVSGTTSSCRLTRGGTVIVNWRPCTSPFVADLAGRADATYTLAVRLTDVAGNVGPAATSNYTLDTTPPSAPVLSGPSSPGSDKTPTWSWNVPAGATASCLLTRAGRVVRDWTTCSSPYTANLTGQPDGTYRLAVRFTDAAGNVGPAASSSYRLDSTQQQPPPPPPVSHGKNPGPPPVFTPGPAVLPPPPPPATVVRVPSRDLGGPAPTLPRTSTGRPALKPTGKQPEQSSSRQLFSPKIPPVGDVPNVIGQVAVKSLEKPQFPLLLLVVVGLFLLIQNRIDRKDPKLASAPVDSEPLLGFGPAVQAP